MQGTALIAMLQLRRMKVVIRSAAGGAALTSAGCAGTSCPRPIHTHTSMSGRGLASELCLKVLIPWKGITSSMNSLTRQMIGKRYKVLYLEYRNQLSTFIKL